MRKDPFAEVYEKQNSGTDNEKYESLPYFPDIIDIELTNNCNMACAMCPTGRDNLNQHKGINPKTKRRKGFMDKFLFFKIMGEIKEYKTPIRFICWGEPTLHPDFWWFIREAKKHDLKIHINTNGTILRELKEPIDSIKMSMHANSKRIRQGLDAIVTMNTYTTASITDKEAEKTGIDITKYPFTELDDAKMYRQFYKGMDAPRPSCCGEAFNKLSIMHNGDATLCCADNDLELLVGNVMEDSIKNIWNSKKADKIRKVIVSGRHFKKFEVCRNCYDLGAV